MTTALHHRYGVPDCFGAVPRSSDRLGFRALPMTTSSFSSPCLRQSSMQFAVGYCSSEGSSKHGSLASFLRSISFPHTSHSMFLDLMCWSLREGGFIFGNPVYRAGRCRSWVLRQKRRWKFGKAADWLGSEKNGGFRELENMLRIFSIKSSSAMPPSVNCSGSGFQTASERLFATNHLKHVNKEVNQGVAEAESSNTKDTIKYIGVRQVRGRFELKLQKNDIIHTLVFYSQKEAAKAYDKAAYKVQGAFAQTNFALTDDEKMEIKGMEWEDLLLQMQLQGLEQTSPCALGFPGIFFKEEEQSWQVTIKRQKKEVYVGLFPSITEATKAYDLAAYKLHGGGALLSRPLSSSERKELMNIDWDSLTARLGLKLRDSRIRRLSGCRGVHARPSGNWHASFKHKEYYFYLGTFDSKAAAAKAYDLFAYKLLGEKAKVNKELLLEEKEFLSTISVPGLRKHLASQAVLAPKIMHLGARGARLVQGQWEVCLQNARKDRIYTSSVSGEHDALRIHDLAVHKLHNGMGKTYMELTMAETQEVESTAWKALVSKFDLDQMPSYHGVNRLISGLWQGYVRHGGAYLPVGTFDSAETAARASDMCEYKLLGTDAILNFTLSEQQKREVDALDWGTLISNLREQQSSSDVLKELEKTAAISTEELSRDKKRMLVLCREQLLQQQIARRAPKVGRQMVVGNPALATQFSPFNRRADGSPMLVEEVMEGYNTPLLWQCACGNIVLKAPMALLRTKQVLCKLEGCNVIPQTPLRVPPGSKRTSLDLKGLVFTTQSGNEAIKP